MGNWKDISGERFGSLVAIERLGLSKNKDYQWRCNCDCGNTFITTIGRLNSGNTDNCGCLTSERRGNSIAKHGMINTPEYYTWANIKKRCYNPNSPDYPKYGGVGVVMQEEWRDDFTKFLEYVGEKPEPKNKYSMDRIDNSKGYVIGNVRWATRSIQNSNKGMSVANKSGVTGVHLQEDVRKDGTVRQVWVASWRRNGRQISKGYNVDKLGYDEAKEMAIKRRGEAVVEVVGKGEASYSPNHGQSNYKPTNEVSE